MREIVDEAAFATVLTIVLVVVVASVESTVADLEF